MLHLLLPLLVPLQVGVTRLAPHTAAGPARSLRPNIVLVLADDVGVDLVAAYGEGAAPPCTPNIDRLASEGLLFRNAWANPTCSPTRACVLTGRHGFRTGIGTPEGAALSTAELFLPELLVEHASAALGKWHLGAGLGASHPNDAGFTRYAGSLGGGVPSYTSWPKTTAGATSTTTVYATTDTADEAILAARTLPEPWFLYVSFNAAHTPLHVPPAELCPGRGCTSFCGGVPVGPVARTKAMLEALDTELGRLLDELALVAPDAFVVFMGDNGTARQAVEAPFDPMRAKGTLYEGGVNVPLIVRGPGVAVGECSALVAAVDLFATFAELAGQASPAEDSVSLVPYLADPDLSSLRTTVYAEAFEPNGPGPWTTHVRAVRDARYKLIRDAAAPDELYDLALDPFETADLVPTLVPGTRAQDAYLALAGELADLGVD
jgi:arylsulfatase A-like enzyme